MTTGEKYIVAWYGFVLLAGGWMVGNAHATNDCTLNRITTDTIYVQPYREGGRYYMADKSSTRTSVRKRVEKSLGEDLSRLRKRMEKAGISQTMLANAMNLHRQQVHRWLSGEAEPMLESMLAINEALERLEAMTPDERDSLKSVR